METREPPSKRPRRPDPLEQLRIGTPMQVAVGRQTGDSDDVIRTNVMNAIKEAIEGAKPVTSQIDLGNGPEMLVNSAGIFRMVLVQPGLNRMDLRAQETYFDVVRDELEKCLKDGGGDFERRIRIIPTK